MKNAMKSRMVYGTLMFGILVAGLFACGDKSAGTSRLEVRMTDAPADYQEVNVDIQGVQVNSQTGDPATGWQSLTISKGVYNLLKFSNGLDTLLGHVDLPAGHVSQIRLVLGTNNSVKINGVTTALR